MREWDNSDPASGGTVRGGLDRRGEFETYRETGYDSGDLEAGRVSIGYPNVFYIISVIGHCTGTKKEAASIPPLM